MWAIFSKSTRGARLSEKRARCRINEGDIVRNYSCNRNSLAQLKDDFCQFAGCNGFAAPCLGPRQRREELEPLVTDFGDL
jgi:hypothetical protein